MKTRIRTSLPWLLLTSLAPVAAQDAPPASGVYKGRQIATTMHYLGAPWLVRESREREEECSTLLRVLDAKPGDVVCDLGCGNGFYTLSLAERVGGRGAVLAVDIQPEMLELLVRRAEEAGVSSRVRPILGTVTDPRLPDGGVDLVLLVDVYHEMSHPELMLAALRRGLAPGGRVVLVEFREEDPNVPIKPLHKMSKRQILKELPPNGLRLVAQFDGLPWQHVMIFDRAPDGDLAKAARAALLRAAQRDRAALPAALRTRIFTLTGAETLLDAGVAAFPVPEGVAVAPVPDEATVREAVEAIDADPVPSVRVLCAYLERAAGHPTAIPVPHDR